MGNLPPSSMRDFALWVESEAGGGEGERLAVWKWSKFETSFLLFEPKHAIPHGEGPNRKDRERVGRALAGLLWVGAVLLGCVGRCEPIWKSGKVSDVQNSSISKRKSQAGSLVVGPGGAELRKWK